MYTRQETFEMSSLAMIRQGRPGVGSEFGTCSYRDGCAAAQLLNPSLWLILHGPACDDPVASHLTTAGHDPHFTRALQSVHDGAVFSVRVDGKTDAGAWRKVWFADLKEFAETRRLNFVPIEEAVKAAGWDV